MTFPPPPQGFSQPSAPNMGDKFEAHEHKGHLLLVFPKRFEENIKTTKGLSDATDADIIIVDKQGPDGRPLVFHGARLFGNLARSVRNDIGGQVLGRLQQITSASGNTPWILENYSDQEAAMAGPVLTAYQQGQFKPTETPMQAPAQQYGAPPANGSTANGAYAPQVTGTPPPQQWQQQAAPAAQWNAAAPAAPPAYGATASPAPQQQWSTPAPVPAPPATPTPAPVTTAVDPGLVAFLAARGVQVTPDMTQEQCAAIASSFPS